MFRLLPVLAASCFQLATLPMEMWSTILRLLDPLELLNTVRADTKWKTICLGDAILKEKMRKAENIELKLAKETIVNPGQFVSVSRSEPKKMFAANVNKKISRKPNPVSSNAVQILKRNSKKRMNPKEAPAHNHTKRIVLCRV